jgi:hypothetical protein
MKRGREKGGNEEEEGGERKDEGNIEVWRVVYEKGWKCTWEINIVINHERGKNNFGGGGSEGAIVRRMTHTYIDRPVVT